MKKALSVLTALAVSSLAWAASDFPSADFPKADFPQVPQESARENVAAKVEQAVSQSEQQAIAQATAARPHDAAVFDMELTVESKFVTNNYASTFVKPCSAVLIDQNWLLASLYCRGVGPTASAYDHHGEISYTKNVQYRKIKKAEIRAKARHARDTIWGRDIFVNEKAGVILLRIDHTNLDLEDEVNTNGGQVASLLIPENPSLVAKYAHEGYINRERFCNFGRCSDAVGLNCQGGTCYETDWELTNGDAGDPLFVVSSRDKKSEFLFGFNNAEIVGSNPQSGSTYSIFTKPVYREMLKTVRANDPAAANRIHNRAKNEKVLH